MHRRQVLKSLSATMSLGFAPNTQLLAKAYSEMEYPDLSYIQSAFAKALTHDPSLLGFTNVCSDFALKPMSIEGKWPKDLAGVFYRNGPARHERGAERYKHLFEGDGMIQEFVLSNGSVTHRGRYIQTPKYRQEQQAGRFLYSGPDSRRADSLAVTSPNSINVANTNVMTIGDKLWALWEAGSPAELDKQSLEFERYVVLGASQRYGQSLKGMPFSAHPKVDPKGDIWNFGLHPSGNLVLYHLSATGQVKKVKVLATSYKGNMLHDFVITDNHILIVLPSVISKYSDHVSGFFADMEYSEQLPLRVIVLDKGDFKEKRQYELPSGFAFHFGNGWEDKDGTFHFDASLYSNLNVLTALSDLMQGCKSEADANAQNVLISLYKNGRHKIVKTGVISEFPRVASMVTGKPNKVLYHVSNGVGQLWNNTVSRLDMKTSEYQHYHYGEDYLVEEHMPVGDNTSELQGYLIGTALHIPSKRTCLNVFKVTNIADGPIARAWLPYHLPIGFHGTFSGV